MCTRHMILDQVLSRWQESSGESDGDTGDAAAGDDGDDSGNGDDGDIPTRSTRFLLLFFFFEIGSYYVALVDLKLAM